MFNFEIPQTKRNPYELRKEFTQAMESKLEKPFTNKNTGQKAIITSRTIGKINSEDGKSEANGFTKEVHFAVAHKLDELYENADFIRSRADRNNNKDVMIHEYKADVVINDEAARVFILLKETTSGIYAKNRIHTMELQEIARQKP